jgi:hypothetical protein
VTAFLIPTFAGAAFKTSFKLDAEYFWPASGPSFIWHSE